MAKQVVEVVDLDDDDEEEVEEEALVVPAASVAPGGRARCMKCQAPEDEMMLHTRLSACNHLLCSSCLSPHFKQALDPSRLSSPLVASLSLVINHPQCPVPACGKAVPRAEVALCVSRDVLRAYDDWVASVLLQPAVNLRCTCGGPLVAFADLGSLGVREIRAALQVRRKVDVGTKAVCLDRLKQSLVQLVATPNSKSAHAASAPPSIENVALCKRCNTARCLRCFDQLPHARCNLERQAMLEVASQCRALDQALSESAPKKAGRASRAPAAAPNRGGSKPKGVGYGGDASQQSKQLHQAVSKAHQHESETDAIVQRSLDAVCDALGQFGSNPPSTLVSLLTSYPFLRRLRQLVANDSVQDVCDRRGLYSSVVALLNAFSGNRHLVLSLVEERTVPSHADPNHTDTMGPVFDELTKLQTQAAVFLRNAEGAGGEEVDSKQSAELAEAICKAHEAIASATKPKQERKKKRKRVGQDPESLFAEALGPHRLEFASLQSSHAFRSSANARQSGAAAIRSRMLLVNKQLSCLSTSLPLSLGSSALVAVDDTVSDLVRFLILPPPDTPYGLAPFVFDAFLPPDYPQSPPSVRFLTTGGGQVYFNPNLYACGKVCLSLLGTWSGPSWDPKHSTLLQVIISIQSLIFVTDPYFNEPGYECSMGTPQGTANSETYNRAQRANTLAFAMLPALLNPPEPFGVALAKYFQHQHNNIVKMVDSWVKKDAGHAGTNANARVSVKRNTTEPIESLAARVKSALQRYPPIDAVEVLD